MGKFDPRLVKIGFTSTWPKLALNKKICFTIYKTFYSTFLKSDKRDENFVWYKID